MSIDIEPFFTLDALCDTYIHYKEVKTDEFTQSIQIPMGADGVTWKSFEKNMDREFEGVKRRVLSGSYYFYPTREVEIPKLDGSVRTLSVAGIRDAIVQRRLYEALKKPSEDIFQSLSPPTVSFGYRKGLSAARAAAGIKKASAEGYVCAFDADIRKFFDTLSHERLMNMVDEWLGKNSLARKMIWRFIRTDRVPASLKQSKKSFMTEKPHREKRTAGVPQGGVLSGMLANLYMHEFDRWIVEEMGAQIPLRYFRYADDFVVLTRSEADAKSLRDPVEKKLKDIGLCLHPDKTQSAVSTLNGDLSFVGFRFSQENVSVREKTVEKFKAEFADTIRKGIKRNQGVGLLETHRRLVTWYINRKIRGREAKFCETCGLPKEMPQNWMAFFSPVVTDLKQIKGIDYWIRKFVTNELHQTYKGTEMHQRLKRKHWRLAKATTLQAEYYRQKRLRRKYGHERCECQDESSQDTDV